MKRKYRLSLKESKLYIPTRDVPRTPTTHFNIITQWKVTGIDYMAKCVFISESGFNADRIRKRT
jgi:hypothetical protein